MKVPAALRNTLSLAAAREDGAVALVSGRSIDELDRLFAPWRCPAAGQYGLERRNANGRLMRSHVDTRVLQPARSVLADLQVRHRGLLLEDKGSALAMHYRLARRCETLVRDTMAQLVAPLQDRFVLRAGRCVIELAPAGYSLRNAIEAFMAEEPFIGRTPVFVGDDDVDEEGFAAVNALGGYSIRVGKAVSSAARYNFGSVSAVTAWLRERNLTKSQ